MEDDSQTFATRGVINSENIPNKPNKSSQVFDVRENKILLRVLNIQDERDQEDLTGHGNLAFLSPTYIQFTISVAIIYGILFVMVCIGIFFFRKYQALKERFADLERRNQELQNQNIQLSTQRQNSDTLQTQPSSNYDLQNQIRLALGNNQNDKAPYDFSSIETLEECIPQEKTARRSPTHYESESDFKSCNESDSMKGFHTPEKRVISNPSIKNLTSTPRNRFLSHDVNPVSPKNIEFYKDLEMINCDNENSEQQSTQRQQQPFMTPSRQNFEDFEIPSLQKSQSSQPYNESHLLTESHDLKNYYLQQNLQQLESAADKNYRIQNLNKSPIFVQDEAALINIRLQNMSENALFSKNLFKDKQSIEQEKKKIAPIVPEINLQKLQNFQSFIQNNPLNDYNYYNQQDLRGQNDSYQMPQRYSEDHQESQPRSYLENLQGNRQIQTERGLSQNYRPLYIQKFGSQQPQVQPIKPTFTNQRFRPLEQKINSQRYPSNKFQNQLKQKTLSLGRQAFQQPAYHAPIYQPRPIYRNGSINHQSNISQGSKINQPFQIQPNINAYQQI